MAFDILDCTLRDGGYYTNWDFDPELVRKYIAAVDELPVKICEIGYRSPLKSGYHGEYFYLRHNTLESISEAMPPDVQLALMLNAKDCRPEIIQSLLQDSKDFVSLVRIAVAPDQLDHGCSIAKSIKECGFSVGVNVMHLHKFIHGHTPVFDKLLSHADSIDYLSFVDSYGSCFPDNVYEIVKDAVHYLPFKIGFHGHDNIGLAFANALSAISAGAAVVDSTILGLGRGAGNLRTELIATYATKIQEKQNDYHRLADCLEIWHDLAKLVSFKTSPDLPYIVSGIEHLPQAEVMELMGKKRFLASTIIQAVRNTSTTSQSRDRFVRPIEECENMLPTEISNKCVIIGGGESAISHLSAIEAFGRSAKAMFIHSSFRHVQRYSCVGASQFVCLSGDEASRVTVEELSSLDESITYVVTTGPKLSPIPEYFDSDKISVFSVEPIRVSDDPLENDTPLGLAIGLAKSMGVDEIFLCGFDGYLEYSDDVEQSLEREVQDLLNVGEQLFPMISLKSITPTKYKLEKTSVYALLSNE